MAAHNNTANRFHDDVIVLEDDAPTRPSGRQRFTRPICTLIVVAFEDFAGNIVVVDLVSDDEETANVNRVDSFANTAPESFSEVTVDDALREILQVLPNIDPKAQSLLVPINGSTWRKGLDAWHKGRTWSLFCCQSYWTNLTLASIANVPQRPLSWTTNPLK